MAKNSSLEYTWDILEVEKLSVHPPDPYRLNRINICESTCKTLTGWRSSPKPTTICRVDGQFSVHQALFWNLRPQPGDLYRLTDNFRSSGNLVFLNLETFTGWRTILGSQHKPGDLYRLTDNFRTSGNIFSDFTLNLETLTGERTIFGPVRKLLKTMETFTGWRTSGFDILPNLLNLETSTGWRTIIGKNG